MPLITLIVLIFAISLGFSNGNEKAERRPRNRMQNEESLAAAETSTRQVGAADWAGLGWTGLDGSVMGLTGSMGRMELAAASWVQIVF